MKINPTDKEKLKSLVNADIENIFAKPNKLGYTYESNTGGFEMKKVKATSSKPPVWFVEFATQVVEFMKEQKEFNEKIVNRLDKIDARLDNIVQKNNLME